MLRATLPLLAVLLAGTLHQPAAAQRTVTPLPDGWRFLQGDPEGAERATIDESGWQEVSVPHDWAIAGPFDQAARGAGENGFLPTGIGWYRRDLGITPQPGRRYFVEFDGIMERSGVWVNGQHVGYRPQGYVSLRYDITRYLRADGPNTIAVRSDTAMAPSSRWYNGSGIYRHARLIETGALHITQGGAFVHTPEIGQDRALVAVSTEVENTTDAPLDARMEIVLTDPAGREVARTTTAAQRVDERRTASVAAQLPIASPRRWHTDDPALYTATIRVLGPDGASDAQDVRFGIRQAEFRADSGFWLNGENIKLKGVALHHDGGAVGAAVPRDVWRQRLTALKALGVNAIRTAHNVPSPEFLDLTDELGLLVMDELFDQWNVAKTPYDYHQFFGDWHKRDTADMIRRDRNHPSIVIWSAGNEIHDTAYPVQAKAALTSILGVAHATDPTRPVTMGLFRPNVTGDYSNGFADMLDVVGQNYRENELIAAHKQDPTRKIVGTENGHNRTNWVPVRDTPANAGMFLWTGIDYLGETNRAGWPFISRYTGLLDRTGLPHIRGFERQSWWAQQPVIHVVRNAIPDAAGPATDGAGGPNQPVLPTMIAVATPQPPVALFDDWTPAETSPHSETIEVYSNCRSVEAFLNGASLGTLPINEDASPRRWAVTWEPGEVRAVCRDAGASELADTLRTAGPATRIELSPDSPAVGSTFDDLTYVRARIVDANGVTVPGAEQVLHFAAEGTGKVIATDNGSESDHTPFPDLSRKPRGGIVTGLVRGTGPGTMVVRVSAEGLPTATIEMPTR
ncbi:glycoside hydrolase family 2 TIM barrel-domain containing protein [Croceibacterium sp. TMG7-5b_MA50]|uniref:glycoside hydrolase family 2 TIM barrel-domain containing protein n=1 Tax=Croceibacterium sp. TMG7-5b_MA50 TaxID=3121290 RepID=UPI003221D3DC